MAVSFQNLAPKVGAAAALSWIGYKLLLRKRSQNRKPGSSTYYQRPDLRQLMQSPIPHKFFINGEFVAPKGRVNFYPAIDPATEEEITSVPVAESADVDAAVKAARKSFDGGEWSKMAANTRADFLRALAQKIREEKTRLATLECWNCGKPYKEAEWDIGDVADCFDYFAGLAETDMESTDVPLPHDDFAGQIIFEPVGVVGAIIPWNYPLLMAAWKLAPALAAGCSLVVKPSEYTPLTLLELCTFIQELGFPRGVVNVVTGTGQITGEALIKHPLVDKLAFTGSVPTGSRVMSAAAEAIKNVTLELGGKSAAIVYNDPVDINALVEWIMFGVFWTNGQICSATSRLLVHEDIAPEVMRKLVSAVQKIPVGPPLSGEFVEKTGTLGPVVSKRQFQRVLGLIDTAIQEAGPQCVLTGGKRVSTSKLPTGYFVEPTIINAGDKDLTIWREEVFGPVLTVKTFRSEQEAIKLANASEFGLGGAVFTRDPEKAARTVRGVRCGIMWVNCSQPCFSQLPWGGVKKSGIGRELGWLGFRSYLEPKTVVTHQAPAKPWGWYHF